MFVLAGAAPGELDGRHLKARRLCLGLEEAVARQVAVRACTCPDAQTGKAHAKSPNHAHFRLRVIVPVDSEILHEAGSRTRIAETV